MPHAVTSCRKADLTPDTGTFGVYLFDDDPFPNDWSGTTRQIRVRLINGVFSCRVPVGLLYYRTDITYNNVPGWCLVNVPAVDTVDLRTLTVLHVTPEVGSNKVFTPNFGSENYAVNGYGQAMPGALVAADYAALMETLNALSGYTSTYQSTY